jgi:hypothetical protein
VDCLIFIQSTSSLRHQKIEKKKLKGTLTVHLDVLAGGYELKNNEM